MLIGCDRPPRVPGAMWGMRTVKLTVSSADESEMNAATGLEVARVNYLYRLGVLEGYYRNVGQMDKLGSATKERKNVVRAKGFRWVGLPSVVPPKGESVENADERLLVEATISAREAYLDKAEKLVIFYDGFGGEDAHDKAKLIRNLQARLDPVRVYMYFMEAEVPSADLRPTKVIPEADQMYARAMRLYKIGKIIPGIPSYSRQRKALKLLTDIVKEYPESTKIALCAYYTAEIYKEFFRENLRAVYWYQRAWQWDSNLPKPAHFQAAVIHDFRLHNYAKAEECYRQTIAHEQFNQSNVRYAHQRLQELAGK
jgi:hypothetical protein